MNSSNSLDEDDNSSDLKWDSMSVTSMQSSMTKFDTIEDVSHAIDACKKAILETIENTDSRKEMVLRLIQLRIRFEDMKERADQASNINNIVETRGHVFVSYQDIKNPIPGVSNVSRIYCQQCGYGIWVHLQSSQHCQDCGYSVHSVCLENIMRGCVAEKIRTEPNFIMEICPEKSLPSLKYRCVECDKKLKPSPYGGLTIGGNEPRLCDYTGLSFCGACHWSATSIIPARVVHNWDFEPRTVSQATKQYLSLMARKPVINVKQENPKLFAVVQELEHVHQLRKNIITMKKYMTLCRIAQQQKILLHLVSRQHFVDGYELYSFQDLIEVKNGSLVHFLENIISKFTEHIHNCVLCLAKGFICELCDNQCRQKSQTNEISGRNVSGETAKLERSVLNCNGDVIPKVIFPFDQDTSTCEDCNSVYHRLCFKRANSVCPKCTRIQIRQLSLD